MTELAKDGERIAHLMRTTVECFHRFLATPEKSARAEIALEMIRIHKEVDDIVADQRAALAALIDRARWTTDENEQVALLLQAFVFAAQLRCLIKDEVTDTNACNEVAKQKGEITTLLDAVGSGRRVALASLLDHEDPRVRGSAAPCLLRIMPERALPVLRAVAEDERSLCAKMDASFTLSVYKHDPGAYK